MSAKTIHKSTSLFITLFLFIILMINDFNNGRTLQAGAETPTVTNFLPIVMQETDLQPPPSPISTPIATPPPPPLATATAPPFPTSPPPPSGCAICSYNAYNCADFSIHDDAQACHDYCFTIVGYDIHQLDGDNDGLACESLP